MGAPLHQVPPPSSTVTLVCKCINSLLYHAPVITLQKTNLIKKTPNAGTLPKQQEIPALSAVKFNYSAIHYPSTAASE